LVNINVIHPSSGQLLLDEERTQVRELPRARGREDGYLDEGPAHDAGVGCLGLVAEFGLTFLEGEKKRS
jgi:hypothetical protein